VNAGQVTEEAQPEPEPEKPTFTLDEYLALRDSARANSKVLGDVAVRTVDASEFSGLKAKQDSEDTFIALGSAKASKAKKDQRSGNLSLCYILTV
jgi:hypothetical protein